MLRGVSIFSWHADTIVLGTTMNERRYTYNKDLLWILNYLSQHCKILKLKLGFCGRRNLRMSLRDRDFLNALKCVKTDRLLIGNPNLEDTSRYDVSFSHSMLFLSIAEAVRGWKSCTVNINLEISHRKYTLANWISWLRIRSKMSWSVLCR